MSGVTYQMSRSPNLGNTNFTGDISEILIYNRVLSDAERLALQQYFAAKYGIGSTDTAAPTTPTGLVSSVVTTSSFTLTWNASTDNVGVTAYQIYQNGTLLGLASTTSIAKTGLQTGTTYSMTVAALDAAGNIPPQSASQPVTTSGTGYTTPPTAPTGLTSSAITTTSFTLSWTASTDNVGVVSYQVYVGGVFYGTSSSPSLSVSGQTTSTTYS